MFIRKAVKCFGVVYKLCSHGAAGEGCTVGRFKVCDAIDPLTHSVYWQLFWGAHIPQEGL